MRFNSALLLALGSFILHASTVLAHLPSGKYKIFSQVEHTPVGRSLFEDRSLLPKRIVVTPEPSVWDVQRLPSGRYILSNRGDPTVKINKKLYAELRGHVHKEWVIQRQVLSGAYTIETSDRKNGWVLPDSEVNTQVNVHPLIVGASHPPFFPANELWQFIPVREN